jgi:uncharacterized membrane protein
MIEKICNMGWQAAKAGILLVALCTLLHIIAGPTSGAFITSVHNNVIDFLQKIPSGTFLGLVLAVGIYVHYKSKQSQS